MVPPPPIGKPRGLLRAEPVAGSFVHERHPPAPDIAAFVEHFWVVAWEIPGEPVIREVLSHPSVHIVFERRCSRIVGVPRGRFTRRLEGTGLVVGIKFHPGAFRPIAGFPIARLTDRSVPLADVFASNDAENAASEATESAADVAANVAANVAADVIERRVLAPATMAGRIAAATSFLRDHLPAPDPVAGHAAAIVKRILDDREIRKVDDLARIVGDSPRALQRLFQDYVGVSPKWVIRRYRLHDALERVDAGNVVDWPTLALELGYFDQAHFSKDFKRLVGRTPTGYAIGSPTRPRPRATAQVAQASRRPRAAPRSLG